MGDEIKEQEESQEEEILTDEDGFTAEELEALGEEVPESLRPAADKGESEEEAETEVVPGSEEQAAEGEEPKVKAGESEEDERVPVGRFKKIDGQRKTLGEKLDLLKTDRDEYYKQYPEERPESKADAVPITDDAVFDGGLYHGKTVGEVRALDPSWLNKWETSQVVDEALRSRDAALKEEAADKQRMTDSQRELDDFSLERAKELTGNKDLTRKGLAADNKTTREVNRIITETLAWSDETGRSLGNLEDAYLLKNHDRLIKEARGQGGKITAKKLNEEPLRSVSNKGSSETVEGWDAYINMDSAQMATAIENMTDDEAERFLDTAPQKLRSKHPGMAWG